MTLHEIQFPDDIAYGATGGPEYLTSVVSMASGHEQRNANWSAARGRWDVASGLKHQAQLDALIAFFRLSPKGWGKWWLEISTAS